jgi:hypothetical protein
MAWTGRDHEAVQGAVTKRLRGQHQGVVMKASVGDRLLIRGHDVGSVERRATIVEVQGGDGGPPYVVHWDDDPHDVPHDHIFFPGPDADVEHHPAS